MSKQIKVVSWLFEHKRKKKTLNQYFFSLSLPITITIVDVVLNGCRSSVIHLVSSGKSHNSVVFNVQPLWIRDPTKHPEPDRFVHLNLFNMSCTDHPKNDPTKPVALNRSSK